MGSRLDRGLLVALTVSAALMATVQVKREFFTNAGDRRGDPVPRTPSFVPDWRSVVAEGIELGDRRAPVKLVEFLDLECPFCRRFHESRLPSIVQRFEPNVSAVFVHFPISTHKFAELAARASECAAEQEVFGAFVHAVFAMQDSLGLRPWSSYARDAGVGDTTRFMACVKSTSKWTRIESGKQTGERIGVRATPGIIMNGWLYPTPPSDQELIAKIERIIASGGNAAIRD